MHENYLRGVYILIFPVVLSIGIVLIPVVSDYADHALASQAVNQTVRWFSGHVLAAVGFGLSVVSVSAINAHLRDQSYRLPAFILPVIAVGAGLYAAGLGADGIGPIAVRASASDPSLFFDGSGWWVSGTFMAAAAFFGICYQ